MRKTIAVLALLLALPAFGQWTDRGDAKRILGKPIGALSASHDGKVLTYNYAAGTMDWTAFPSTLSGLTATRVPFALNATTLEDDSGLTYAKASDALTVAGSVITPSIAPAANVDLKLFSSGTGGILGGTVTTVGSKTGCSSAGTTTITCTTHGLTLYPGDLVRVTSATTAADIGMYSLISSGVSTLVVSRALAGTDADVALTVYRQGLWSGPLRTMLSGSTVLNSYQSGSVDAIGLDVHYTSNLSGAANDTGLRVIKDADTSSPGTSYIISAYNGATREFSVSDAGALYVAGGINSGTTWSVGSGSVYSTSAGSWLWSSTAGVGHTKDLGFSRSAAGVLEINAGTPKTANGRITARSYMTPLVADAVMQPYSVVMADASADGSFDVNGVGGTLAIGVVDINPATAAATVQGTTYNIVEMGVSYLIPDEDVAVTRGHILFQDASVAGRVDDNAALQAAGTNIGVALYSEPVTYTIDPTGCGSSCVNTTSETITLSSAPGWAVGDPVVYYNSGGSSIGGLVEGEVIWIKTISGADITVSTTQGGAAMNLTSAGDDATQYIQRLPQAIVNIR